MKQSKGLCTLLKKVIGHLRSSFLSKRNEKYDAKLSFFFKQESQELFHVFSKTLRDRGITFWLEYGSLLGYYRNHDYLPNDDDFDFGAYLDDASNIREALLSAGFEIARYYRDLKDGGIEECYRYKEFHTTVDVFYFAKTKDNLVCTGFRPILDMSKKKNLGKEVPFGVRKLIFPLTEFTLTSYKNEEVFVPVNCHEHLAAHYGPDFMIPCAHFNNNTANNVTLYSYEERPAIGYLKYGYYDLAK